MDLVAAVDREEIDALDDLKATNEIITSSLNNDLQLVQSRHKNLIIDYDQQRAHLVDALLDRENLRKEHEAAKRGRPTLDPESVDDNRKTGEAVAAEEKAKTASQALKEVSHEFDSPKGRPFPRRGFWTVKNIFLPRSKHPYTPQLEPFKYQSTRNKEPLGAEDLARERQAIGTLQGLASPGLSLPRPSPVRGVRTDVYRSQAKRMDETDADTDIPRSNPKSKK